VKKQITVFGVVLLGVLLAGVLTIRLCGHAVRIDKYDTADRPARIYPDYSSTVIPPNIAPLNFMIKEEGAYYHARIYSEKGEAIEVFSRSPKILIPLGRWHKLLDKNRGGELHFDIFVRTAEGSWVRFGTITNKIAGENIDGYLVYRKMHPTYIMIRGHVGIYQRNLRDFDERLVLDDQRYRYTGGCVNCHTFCNNRPDKALIGVRTRKQGDITLLIEHKTVSRLGVKLGFTAWHPSGRLAAYSLNKLFLFFRTAKDEVRDVVDMDSMLAYFVVDTKTIKTTPEISRKERLETWPMWSADGRYLYFCSAPKLWPDQTTVLPERYAEVKYDLVRISYDVENDKWGKVETVLSAKDTGLSIAIPRTSPDGRWMIFCMLKYGCFPPWQQSSDLYIMDLKAAEATGKYEYHRMEINSDQSEAWHGWSSNSRWIVFSSKREHGPFTRSYLSYVDESGKAYKPLAVPQEDPEFYGYCLEMFNTPDFATGPIATIGERLARVVRGSAEVSVQMPMTMATPKASGTLEQGQSWRGRE
jgi:hypothetical protein